MVGRHLNSLTIFTASFVDNEYYYSHYSLLPSRCV